MIIMEHGNSDPRAWGRLDYVNKVWREFYTWQYQCITFIGVYNH